MITSPVSRPPIQRTNVEAVESFSFLGNMITKTGILDTKIKCGRSRASAATVILEISVFDNKLTKITVYRRHIRNTEAIPTVFIIACVTYSN